MPADTDRTMAGNRSGRGPPSLSREQWRLIAGALHLSGRQLQIVQWVFDDGDEASLAEELGISPHTVHTHLQRLYKKLDVGSRCALIARAFAEYVSLESADGADRRVPRSGVTQTGDL